MAPARTDIDVLLPLAVGAATTCATILIHALALVTIVHFVRRERRLRGTGGPAGSRIAVAGSALAGSLAGAGSLSRALGLARAMSRTGRLAGASLERSALA